MGGRFLNPHASIRVASQGDEGEPVIVIDALLADPEYWRAEASSASYGQHGPHYPGVRAIVPHEKAAALRAELAPLVDEVFGVVPALLNCFYSIVTVPPAALAPIQRLPHFDGLERDRIAILIYLSGAEQGGTAFYRQRATGFETIDAERFPAFESALRAGVAAHGMPPPAYIGGDGPLYEQIAVHEARPNRALIYRSYTLHCAAIPPGAALPADPVKGRLSINAFLFDGTGR